MYTHISRYPRHVSGISASSSCVQCIGVIVYILNLGLLPCLPGPGFIGVFSSYRYLRLGSGLSVCSLYTRIILVCLSSSSFIGDLALSMIYHLSFFFCPSLKSLRACSQVYWIFFFDLSLYHCVFNFVSGLSALSFHSLSLYFVFLEFIYSFFFWPSYFPGVYNLLLVYSCVPLFIVYHTFVFSLVLAAFSWIILSSTRPWFMCLSFVLGLSKVFVFFLVYQCLHFLSLVYQMFSSC